jgi:hypothetical protein
MNGLQEDEMNHAEKATVHPDNDYFIVRERIAEEHARVRAENAASRVDRAVGLARGPARAGAARAWLGRRLVALGTVLAGDTAAAEARSTSGRTG